MAYSPTFDDFSRLISPEIDASGYTEIVLLFNHMMDDYGGGYSIGVATRSSGGGWNTVWSQNVSSDIPTTTQNVVINNDDVGQSDFQFCIYFSGNSYNKDNWYIDNILLFNPLNLDLATVSVNNVVYSGQGDITVDADVTDMGSTPITSFDMNYSINGGDTYTTSFTGLNLGLTDSYNCIADDIWAATPGDYTLTVWVSNINGGDDDNPDNNLLEKDIHIATQGTQRRPLYGEFTSSTSAPCAGFNSNTFLPFLEDHGDDVCVIKYQMNWPSPGDPYYTEEGGVRKSYYGVSGVPNLVTDGVGTVTNSAGVNGAYNNSMANPAFMDMSGTFSVEGTTISVNAIIDSYVGATDLTLHVVVIENETTGNTGNNGETEFHYVMMKMLPDANGTTIALTSGEQTSISFEQDLQNTFVEEYDDLSVVLFIQNNATQEVFQSAYASQGALPAPVATVSVVNGAIDVPVNEPIVITFDQPIRNIDDTELTDANIDEHVIFNLIDINGDAVDFDATIDAEKRVITVTPNENLAWGDSYYLAMEATVENYYDVAIIPFEISFTADFNTGIEINTMQNISVYPNPVNGIATIEFSLKETSSVELVVYNVSGQIVYTSDNTLASGNQKLFWNTGNVKNGVYFCNINTANQSKTVRISVMK